MGKHEQQNGVSRRSFLKASGATAAVAAGALLWGCAPSSAQDGASTESGIPTSWDEEADVVVVGGGGAGMSAALMAAEAGASVIVLEKGPTTGGSTALCGQAIMGVGTSVQKAAGIEDSVEEAMKYFSAIGDGRDDLVRFVVENSADAVEWLIGLGMQVPAEIGNPGLVFGGQEKERADLTAPVMRTHYAVKPDPGLWPVLQKAADAQESIAVRTGTPVTKLVQHPDTGEVLGVAKTFEDALLKGLVGAGYSLRQPTPGKCVILTVKDADKRELVDIAWQLKDMGYKLYGTSGTAYYLGQNMVACNEVRKLSEARPNIMDLFESGLVDYVISTSSKGRIPSHDSVKMRRKAVELSIPCLTAIDTARVLVKCLRSGKTLADVDLVDISTI